MIRSATKKDLLRIVEMSEKFYASTNYSKFAMFSAPTVYVLADTLIQHGVMLVAEEEEKVVGMVGLILTPFLFNAEYVGAYEVVWWVEPSAQASGIGRALLEAVEPACKAKAPIRLIQMVTLPGSPPQAAQLYEKLGFHHSESSYTKVV